MPKTKSVLFVCTANRYRSPFAAAVFQKRLETEGVADQWRVDSAGTWAVPNLPAFQDIVQKAQEFGLDLSKHLSREITREMLDEHDVIIVMETGHKEALVTEFPQTKEKIFLLSELADHVAYDVPDPLKNIEEADEIAREIYDLVQRGYADICDAAEKTGGEKGKEH